MENPLLSQKEITPTQQFWFPTQGQWTYEDWLQLPDDGYRYEVIDGVLHMSPPPRTDHQRISFRLARRLGNFAEKHSLGEVFSAPTGVRLPNQPVPVQPDILFIRAER
ncbi:MAG: Uma2 family endonuclease, partial [Deltaproteobacteria bacterium]|nr:Uma2 family endonuclease [Deltaproteobacteria bacterium]